jgi:hypothetical protein
MATVEGSNLKVLANAPFLIKKMDIALGTTAADLLHGEARAPDIVFLTNTTAAAGSSEASAVIKGATEITVDGQADSTSAILYMIWLTQASGGVTL